MADDRSFADFMAAWARMLTAILVNRQKLPDLSGIVAPLQALLDEARDLDASRAAARAHLSQTAKRARSMVPEGRAAAARLRGALIAHFGSHNEALLEYGIKPVRTRRAQQQPDPLPPSPPVPIPLPE